MNAIAALLIGMMFISGCTPAMIEEEQIKYEEALFEGAETIHDKLDILNEEYMKTLFSVDRKKDENILIKLSLYGTPGFVEAFEENTYPVLRNIARRDFVKKGHTDWTQGSYIKNDEEMNAYQSLSTVTYYQNDNLLKKQIEVVYIINDEDDIQIVEMKEYEPTIMEEKLSD